MGKTTRWLKSIFGIKSNKDKGRTKDFNHWKDMKRSTSGIATGFCYNHTTLPPNITSAEAAWLRSFHSESNIDLRKHAMVLAQTISTPIEENVEVVHVPEVVQQTSKSSESRMFSMSQEDMAAIKIQKVFRGCLARKARRALKALVKVQARVRGILVRKQATSFYHGMQVVMKIQASVLAPRTQQLINNDQSLMARKSQGKRDGVRNNEHRRRPSTSFDESPEILELDIGLRTKSRLRRKSTLMPDIPENSFHKPIPPPSPCQTPVRLARPNICTLTRLDQESSGDESHFSKSRSTPRYARSVCADSSGGESPNYMSQTESFKAKLKSHSTPMKMSESGPKRSLSLHEVMESRISVSGVRMQRSCSYAQ